MYQQKNIRKQIKTIIYCIINAMIAAPIMDGITHYYNHYYQTPQMCSFPSMLTEWNPMAVPNTYKISAPVISPRIVTSVLCPYTGVLVTGPIVPVNPTVAVDVMPGIICSNICSHVHENFTEVVSDEFQYEEDNLSNQEEVEEEINKLLENEEQNVNPLDAYMRLPKHLFPKPNMLSIDPNIMIDEFCKSDSISGNYSWILDIEFGKPRVPVKRVIAIYDVKLNSIHCKNTPDAIHPGFEKCKRDLKRAILFYYDCIVSNWYNGYIALKGDKSVENFQSWLQLPMQTVGMCWA